MNDTFVQTVQGDLLDIGSAAMQYIENKLLTYLPEVIQDLKDCVAEAIQDAQEGDGVEVIVTKVLNLAEARGSKLIGEIETDIISGLVALARIVPQ